MGKQTYDEYIGCRLRSETKAGLNEIAKGARREPSEYLRMLVEDHVEQLTGKSKKRTPAAAAVAK